LFCLLVVRAWDAGRSLVTVVLLAERVVREEAAAVVIEEDEAAVAFVGGRVDGWGGLTLARVVVEDVELPAWGAVERVVVCWSEVFGAVEGRVVFTTGLVVGRDGADAVAVVVVVELAAGFGFDGADDTVVVVAVFAEGFGWVSR